MYKFRVSFLDSNLVNCRVNLPSKCPHCGMAISPQIVFDSPKGVGYFNGEDDNSRRIVFTFRCTNEKCRKYFLNEYHAIKYYKNDYRGQTFDYIECEIINYSYLPDLVTDIPTNVEELSPTFYETYQQAFKAEKLGFDKIDGMAFRKSLEFLIKDYCSRKFPDKINQIKSQPLGAVISEHLSDFPKLQKLSKASNWISTDAVHYEQRFDENDIESLKLFIKSSLTFISADLAADEAEKFIAKNDPKKQNP